MFEALSSTYLESSGRRTSRPTRPRYQFMRDVTDTQLLTFRKFSLAYLSLTKQWDASRGRQAPLRCNLDSDWPVLDLYCIVVGSSMGDFRLQTSLHAKTATFSPRVLAKSHSTT
ncbi:hypothetical protein T265_07076 [Opisthorchis viverrini]|uniref:Uncharacterized protein n=1 Tax=Opisthorchis viverrini TaxID=6198 RepID=A0A074ZDU1_OPIVI|nr:hypothetical protein T265_07076 [Opisthorchis viverrini]KER25451.1 hypothetical protein T265_07076 [Opisthorchis viverrini]